MTFELFFPSSLPILCCLESQHLDYSGFSVATARWHECCWLVEEKRRTAQQSSDTLVATASGRVYTCSPQQHKQEVFNKLPLWCWWHHLDLYNGAMNFFILTAIPSSTDRYTNSYTSSYHEHRYITDVNVDVLRICGIYGVSVPGGGILHLWLSFRLPFKGFLNFPDLKPSGWNNVGDLGLWIILIWFEIWLEVRQRTPCKVGSPHLTTGWQLFHPLSALLMFCLDSVD